jgi:uncharacterized protein (DUF1800 family)
MIANAAVIALNRFGLGARPGDTGLIAADARGALLAELSPDVALLEDVDLPSSGAAMEALRAFQDARKAERIVAGQPAAPGQTMSAQAAMPTAAQTAPSVGATQTAPGMMSGGMTDGGMMGGAAAFSPDSLYRAEIAARVRRARQAEIGYTERLVAFWTNHFAVQAASGEIERALVGAFEREAIRPYVFGRFHDMLVAVTQHPAMLAYLNNVDSVGPDSQIGQRQKRGLNENHARELMELHTIGVDAGYTQTDVTSVADILSGWSFSRGGNDKIAAGQFEFRANAHEPGTRTIMGKAYAEPGEQQGMTLLADLAGSPATARHLASKLALSFIADSPPQAAVDQLAHVFSTSGGDLMQVSRALVTMDAAWQGPGRFRTPQQFVLAGLRALDIDPPPDLIVRSLRTLGQMPWDPPSPAGYDDSSATWLAPDAITTRLDIANQFAQLTDATTNPSDLAADIFAGAASGQTTEAVARAETRHQGLSLMLMSPDFQRI